MTGTQVSNYKNKIHIVALWEYVKPALSDQCLGDVKPIHKCKQVISRSILFYGIDRPYLFLQCMAKLTRGSTHAHLPNICNKLTAFTGTPKKQCVKMKNKTKWLEPMMQ